MDTNIVSMLYFGLRCLPVIHSNWSLQTLHQVPVCVTSSVLCMLYVMCCNRVTRWAAWDGVTTSHQWTKCHEQYDYFCGSQSHVHIDVIATQSGVSNKCMYCPPLYSSDFMLINTGTSSLQHCCKLQECIRWTGQKILTQHMSMNQCLLRYRLVTVWVGIFGDQS